MSKIGANARRLALTSFVLAGMISLTAFAGDLSKYRSFQFGMDLPTVVEQTRTSLSQARAIHHRPALIQELSWRPQPLGWSSEIEPAQEVVFTFYEGELSRIVVEYDRHATEGLSTQDLVEIISETYGKPSVPARAAQNIHGDRDENLARWQDSQYRFDLIRSGYERSIRLIGVFKRLEGPTQAAILEAKRLDEQEAPQRDAARIASEQEAAKVKLEKARLVNKPNFRP